MASKIDKLIDKAEETNQAIRDLAFAVAKVPQKTVPLPPIVRGLLPAAQATNQFLADTYFDTARAIADVILPADVAREVINNPNVLMDANGSISQIPARPAAAKPRKVTKKMRQQRKIQSNAFRNANAKARKQDGTLRAGYDQQRIALMAQRECTKERQRLGLCEKPKKRKSKK